MDEYDYGRDQIMKGLCPIDGLKYQDHQRCSECGIYVGSAHVYKALVEVVHRGKRKYVCPRCAHDGPTPPRCSGKCVNGFPCFWQEQHIGPHICGTAGCPCPRKRMQPLILEEKTPQKRRRR